MEPASKWEAVGKRLVLTKTGFASVEMRRKDKDTDPVGGGFLLKGMRRCEGKGSLSGPLSFGMAEFHRYTWDENIVDGEHYFQL